MKTEEEIKEKLKWLNQALEEIKKEDWSDDIKDLESAKIWAKIDLIKWLGINDMSKEEVEQFDRGCAINQAENGEYVRGV